MSSHFCVCREESERKKQRQSKHPQALREGGAGSQLGTMLGFKCQPGRVSLSVPFCGTCHVVKHCWGQRQSRSETQWMADCCFSRQASLCESISRTLLETVCNTTDIKNTLTSAQTVYHSVANMLAVGDFQIAVHAIAKRRCFYLGYATQIWVNYSLKLKRCD